MLLKSRSLTTVVWTAMVIKDTGSAWVGEGNYKQGQEDKDMYDAIKNIRK